MGYTLYPVDDIENLDDLLEHADKAMYQAKSDKDQRVYAYDPTNTNQ
jgi:GGDEF domain-containing protein